MEEVWKQINGKLVNPNWVIADYYDVSNKGRIRNNKTNKILNSSNGKYMLHCKKLGYSWCSHAGDRGTFYIKNIMKATFENINAFGKHFK